MTCFSFLVPTEYVRSIFSMAYSPPEGFMDDLDQAEQYLYILTQLLTLVRCYIRMKRLHQEELDAAAQREMTRPPRKKRRYWVSPYLQARPDQGHYHNLMKELALLEPERFRNYLRLDKDVFDDLVERLRPSIERQSNFREPLSVGIRLAITLRYLATGDTLSLIHI